MTGKKMSQLDRPRIKNRKNKTWLHSHRTEILMMWQSGETLQTIAECLEASAALNGKKVSKQLISSYLLRYPPELEKITVIEPESKPLKPVVKKPSARVENTEHKKKPVPVIEPASVVQLEDEQVSTNPFKKKFRGISKEPEFDETIPLTSKYI